MDYITWTREDRNAFDNARAEAFKPTPQEIEAQIKQEEDKRRQMIDSKLSSR